MDIKKVIKQSVHIAVNPATRSGKSATFIIIRLTVIYNMV